MMAGPETNPLYVCYAVKIFSRRKMKVLVFRFEMTCVHMCIRWGNLLLESELFVYHLCKTFVSTELNSVYYYT